MNLVKTEYGHQVLKDRSIRLTPRQRSAFILFDGRRSIPDVLATGVGITRQDIEEMIELGLVADSPIAGLSSIEQASANRSSFALPGSDSSQAFPALQPGTDEAPQQTRTPQQKYQDAYPIATRLTASLGLRGFRLNLAVEASSSLDELLALAPKIRAAVGNVKAEELDRALGN
ncbi:conserved hypothetical protein [Burkholderiales bacterium 8X]|nr:conserved hypothetical protein [Burkholderiales bacterium 8X]